MLSDEDKEKYLRMKEDLIKDKEIRIKQNIINAEKEKKEEGFISALANLNMKVVGIMIYRVELGN